ncbi:unnamed protein product, partial [Gulo gulo]
GYWPIFSWFRPSVGRPSFAHSWKTHLLHRHHILVLTAPGFLCCESTCRSLCDHDCKNDSKHVLHCDPDGHRPAELWSGTQGHPFTKA